MTTTQRPFRDREIERSLRAAAEIGIAVLRKYHRKLKSVEKKGTVDLVTLADREAEEKVLAYLARRHPLHALIGEETWKGTMPAPSGFAWVLDPVDGTTNYAHGLDHHAFSLGLLLDGEPVTGIVVDPARDDVYHATRGRGAWRNRERLRVSQSSRLVDSLIATGFPYRRKNRLGELAAVLSAFLARVQDIRRFGVASLDLAFTAAGHFDGYYEGPLRTWDVAAGILLVTEAGGRVTNYEGGPVDIFDPAVVASNGKIHRAMLRVIRDARDILALPV